MERIFLLLIFLSDSMEKFIRNVLTLKKKIKLRVKISVLQSKESTTILSSKLPVVKWIVVS